MGNRASLRAAPSESTGLLASSPCPPPFAPTSPAGSVAPLVPCVCAGQPSRSCLTCTGTGIFRRASQCQDCARLPAPSPVCLFCSGTSRILSVEQCASCRGSGTCFACLVTVSRHFAADTLRLHEPSAPSLFGANTVNSHEPDAPTLFDHPIEYGVPPSEDASPSASFGQLSPEAVQFHPVNVVGYGSYAVVYRGDLRVGVSHLPVAIKVFKDAVPFDQVLAELEKLAGLDHCNVVKSLGYVTGSSIGIMRNIGSGALVLEWCPGGDLLRFLKTTLVSLESRIGYLIQISNGMKYLHSQSIIHRDLKLANILIGSEGILKICDFGVSTSVESMGQTLAGSVGYMAPEHFISRRKRRDAKALDIYSFAILAWELLLNASEMAFEQERKEQMGNVSSSSSSSSIVEFGRNIAKRGLRPNLKKLEQIGVPRSCVTLVRRCWVANPLKRPPFEEVSETLVAIARDEPLEEIEVQRRRREEVKREELSIEEREARLEKKRVKCDSLCRFICGSLSVLSIVAFVSLIVAWFVLDVPSVWIQNVMLGSGGKANVSSITVHAAEGLTRDLSIGWTVPVGLFSLVLSLIAFFPSRAVFSQCSLCLKSLCLVWGYLLIITFSFLFLSIWSAVLPSSITFRGFSNHYLIIIFVSIAVLLGAIQLLWTVFGFGHFMSLHGCNCKTAMKEIGGCLVAWGSKLKDCGGECCEKCKKKAAERKARREGHQQQQSPMAEPAASSGFYNSSYRSQSPYGLQEPSLYSGRLVAEPEPKALKGPKGTLGKIIMIVILVANPLLSIFFYAAAMVLIYLGNLTIPFYLLLFPIGLLITNVGVACFSQVQCLDFLKMKSTQTDAVLVGSVIGLVLPAIPFNAYALLPPQSANNAVMMVIGVLATLVVIVLLVVMIIRYVKHKRNTPMILACVFGILIWLAAFCLIIIGVYQVDMTSYIFTPMACVACWMVTIVGSIVFGLAVLIPSWKNTCEGSATAVIAIVVVIMMLWWVAFVVLIPIFFVVSYFLTYYWFIKRLIGFSDHWRGVKEVGLKPPVSLVVLAAILLTGPVTTCLLVTNGTIALAVIALLLLLHVSVCWIVKCAKCVK